MWFLVLEKGCKPQKLIHKIVPVMSKFGLVDGFDFWEWKGWKALRTRCVFKDPPTRKSRHQGLQKKKRRKKRSFLTTHAMLLTLLFLGLIVLWSPLDASPFAQKSARRFFGDAVYADYFSFCLSYDWVFHSESGRGSLKWWLMETGGKTGSSIMIRVMGPWNGVSWRPREVWPVPSTNQLA